jgi:hypothetical protein|nr:hypothetical protein [Kofleriaceae bacterium]
MKTLVAVAAALCASAGVARADDTFEARAADARAIRHVEDLAWPLVAPCDRGDDTEQRQCRHVRDARAKELVGQTVLVDAEPEAFTAGAWNPQRKSVTLVLQACVRCAGVDIDGHTIYVVGTQPGGAATHFEGGRARPVVLSDTARPFSDEAAATAWLHGVRRVKVQLLLKVTDKAAWTAQGRSGLAFEVTGYRVISPCDGQIVLAKPASSPVPPDDRACKAEPQASDVPADGSPVDALSESMVHDAMQPVVDAADDCHDRYGVAGKARLAITIADDGTVVKSEQTGDFVDSPTGACIDKAMRKVVFPRSKKPRTTIVYPIVER